MVADVDPPVADGGAGEPVLRALERPLDRPVRRVEGDDPTRLGLVRVAADHRRHVPRSADVDGVAVDRERPAVEVPAGLVSPHLLAVGRDGVDHPVGVGGVDATVGDRRCRLDVAGGRERPLHVAGRGVERVQLFGGAADVDGAVLHRGRAQHRRRVADGRPLDGSGRRADAVRVEAGVGRVRAEGGPVARVGGRHSAVGAREAGALQTAGDAGRGEGTRATGRPSVHRVVSSGGDGKAVGECETALWATSGVDSGNR